MSHPEAYDPEVPDIPTAHQKTIIGICIVAFTISIVGSTIALFINHYNNVSRSLSLRRGAQRRWFVVLFLVLAGICFFAVTTMQYLDADMRSHFLGTLNGKIHPIVHNFRKRATSDEYDDHAIGDQEFEDARRTLSDPDSSHKQRWNSATRILYGTWLSQWLHRIFKSSLDSGPDIEGFLAENLVPFKERITYWWSVEYWFGALAWFFFLSYQTRLRSLPWSTPILLTLLAVQFSLSGSQSLLFALMLMSPIRDTSLERWSPNRTLLLAPFWLHTLSYAALPSSDDLRNTAIAIFITDVLAYGALVSVAWIHPRRLGRYHATAFQARNSRATTFALLALPIVLLRIYTAACILWKTSARHETQVWWYARILMPKEAAEEVFEVIHEAASSTISKLAAIGRFNAMAWDAVLSTLLLGLWTALAESGPRNMLRCTLLPWLKDEEEILFQQQERTLQREETKRSWLNAMKQLASAKTLTRFSRSNQDEGPTTGTAESYVRKRGRPLRHRKSTSENESGYAIIRSRSKSKSRSPKRSRKSVSPAKHAVSRARSQSRPGSKVRQHARSDIANGTLGITVAGWEAAAVSWCLAIFGGLGVAMIATFGAEAADFM